MNVKVLSLCVRITNHLFWHLHFGRKVNILLLILKKSQNYITVGDAFAASRLEEEWSTEHWGSIAGSHDIEASVVKMNVIAANLFLNFLPSESKKIPINN